MDNESSLAARQRRGGSKSKEGLISSDTTAVKRVSLNSLNNIECKLLFFFVFFFSSCTYRPLICNEPGRPPVEYLRMIGSNGFGDWVPKCWRNLHHPHSGTLSSLAKFMKKKLTSYWNGVKNGKLKSVYLLNGWSYNFFVNS